MTKGNFISIKVVKLQSFTEFDRFRQAVYKRNAVENSVETVNNRLHNMTKSC